MVRPKARLALRVEDIILIIGNRDRDVTPPKYTWLWIVFLTLVISGCISRLYFGVFVRDQAELVAFSQQFSLIYDEQIPVLSWLMTGLFRLTDYFILWPDIYKFTCLGLCLFSIFKLTFHVTKDSHLAVVAALSLFFLPTFHDDMLSELTHSAALLAAAALSTNWLVRQTPQHLMKSQALTVLIGFWLFGFLAKHTMSSLRRHHLYFDYAYLHDLCEPNSNAGSRA